MLIDERLHAVGLSEQFVILRGVELERVAFARERWRRVLSRLGPDQPDHAMVKQRLDSLGG